MITKAQKYEAKIKNFKTTKHAFNKKVCHWVYCSGCGLVALNNEVSRKAMQKPCYSMEESE